MLFRLEPHPIYALPLLLYPLLKLTLHLLNQIIIEVYLLLQLLYCNRLQKVSHGTLPLITFLSLFHFTFRQHPIVEHLIKESLRSIWIGFFKSIQLFFIILFVLLLLPLLLLLISSLRGSGLSLKLFIAFTFLKVQIQLIALIL